MSVRDVRMPVIVGTIGVVAIAGAMLAAQGRGRGGAPAEPRKPPMTDGEFTIKPPFANATELIVDNAAPHGTLHRFTMKSQDSKIYSGISRAKPGAVVPYERPVAVYIPPGYVPGSELPFIVVQDGYNPKYHLTVPTILDNLINQKRVPPIAAVLIQHGGGDGPGSQRGLEYDTVSDVYTKFVETEVLPKISKDYNIKFTTDPNGRATMGGSSGAACAMTMAWFHPELYRRVLSYSGTFVNQENPQHPEITRGAWEYHQTLIPNNPPKPIRIWLEVGSLDNGNDRDEASLHNWVLANQHMAAALKAKGYHYQFWFAEGARHTDANVIYQTLPQALEWLWADYAVKK